jgi:hypothetical protein
MTVLARKIFKGTGQHHRKVSTIDGSARPESHHRDTRIVPGQGFWFLHSTKPARVLNKLFQPTHGLSCIRVWTRTRVAARAARLEGHAIGAWNTSTLELMFMDKVEHEHIVSPLRMTWTLIRPHTEMVCCEQPLTLRHTHFGAMESGELEPDHQHIPAGSSTTSPLCYAATLRQYRPHKALFRTIRSVLIRRNLRNSFI